MEYTRCKFNNLLKKIVMNIALEGPYIVTYTEHYVVSENIYISSITTKPAGNSFDMTGHTPHII
jgi:hypothetical protein